MKHYIYIITALLPIFLLAACVQEEITGNNQNSDMITLNVSVSGTSAATRAAVAPEGKESNISNLYILFYKAGGGDEAKPDYFCSATGVEGSVWTKSFLLSSTNLEKDASYDVYTLANLPSNPPTGETTKGDLLAMKESIAIGQVRKPDGSDISLSSYKESTFSISATKANEYTVDLIRTVARLDMSIDTTKISADWAIESVNLINEQLSTDYYQKNTTSTADIARIGQVNRLLNQDGKSQWRYYLYETPKNVEPKVSLKINLKSKTSASTRSYTAIVNKKGGGEIVRNYIYQSTILLTDKVDPVVIETTPLVWNDTIGVNVSIPSVYLDFPTSNILLSDRGAGVYNFKSDADSVYIKTDMPNLVIQSILGKNEGYILPKVDSKDVYELNMIMSSYTTSQETGKITFKAGNLTKEMTVEKPVSNASFRYSVSPCDSWTPDNIRTYDWQTESDAQFNIELKGVVGQVAWFGFAIISQTDHTTGKTFYVPDGAYQREHMLQRHSFSADTTFVFDIKDLVNNFPFQREGTTWVYKMICGPSDYYYAPTMKEFIFAVKWDKDN